MFAWLKSASLWAAAAVVAGGVAFYAVPKVKPFIGGPTPHVEGGLKKTAYDENGNVLTGPVTAGQVIQYVLSYGLPSSGTSGPTTITDVLSGNQTYIPNTIVAPTWTTSTPEYASNTETYTHPGYGPTNFIFDIPVITGTAGPKVGTGDGYEPIPVVTSTGTKVFGIHHHMPSGGADPRIMCWYGNTMNPCSPAYPMMAGPLPERRATPDFPHGAIFQKKIYYPSGRYYGPITGVNQTIELGMGCWNAETDTPCPFVLLPGQPVIATGTNPLSAYFNTNLDGYVTGVRSDPANPSHMYVYALDKLYCVDVSLSGAPACTGWTVPTVSPDSNTGRSRDMFVEEGGTRIFISNTTPIVLCYDLSSGATCSGWPATGQTGGATIATTNLGPSVDSSGTMNGICVSQGFGQSHFKCLDLATGAAITTAWPNALYNNQIFAAYHLPGTARVLFPPYNSGQPKCFDFATNALCAPFTPSWSNSNSWTDSGGNTVWAIKDYGYHVDPQAPDKCIYGLGDGGILIRFAPDGSQAKDSCIPETYHQTFSADEQFCFKKPTVATWTTLDILNRPSQLTGGTIVLKDSAGTVLQTITVGGSSSYALNLSAIGLSSSITVDFTPTYAGNVHPTTDYQLKIGYTANEDPQICYKTTVHDCGEVSNTATLVNELGTSQASVDLGKVQGGECNPIGDCLKFRTLIAVNPDGTGLLTLLLTGPPGFTSSTITVTPQTMGVGIVTPEQIIGNGQTSASWAMTGLVPGMHISLQVDAVETGGGSKPGTDKCCSRVVDLVVPDPKVPDDKTPPTDVIDHRPPPPPPPPLCDKRSTKLYRDECACRYENMLRKNATTCTCPIGEILVVGEGCMKKKLTCEKLSTKAKGDTCECRYQGMKRLTPSECMCSNGQILVQGVGCVTPSNPKKPEQSDKPAAPVGAPRTNGKPGTASVTTPPVTKTSPSTTTEQKTDVTPPKPVSCDDGMEADADGKCVKKSSVLGDVLGHIHFGVGLGGGGGGGGSSNSGPKLDVP